MRFYAYIYVFAYLLLIITLFLLPIFSFEGYSITKNTLSELGAQKAPGNWLANSTIILLSLAVVLLSTKQLKLYWKQLVVLYFFAISFFLMGIYQLAGFDAHTHIFNYTDDALHSLFTMIAGFAFCLFCVYFIFIVRKKRHRWQTLAAFSLALAAPILMLLVPEYRGLFQRFLYLGVFGWLFYALTTYTFKSDIEVPSTRWKHFKKVKEHFQSHEE